MCFRYLWLFNSDFQNLKKTCINIFMFSSFSDTLIQCGSCNGTCGTKMNHVYPGHLCSCDVFCSYNGDCCADFQQLCPDEFHDFQLASEQNPLSYKDSDFLCLPIYISSIEMANNLVVHTCATDGSECPYTPGLSEDINTIVPMYDPRIGVHYISGHCAICNGAFDVIPWRLTLACDSIEEDEHREYLRTGLVNSTESFDDVRASGNCLKHFRLPVGSSRPCLPAIKSCPASCRNQNLVRLCESGFQSLMVKDFTVYWNTYCAVCNAQSGETETDLTCNVPERAQFDQKVVRVEPPAAFSLTLVFDFDPRRGLSVGPHKPLDCAPGEVYVPHEYLCRQVVCLPGFVHQGSECIPEASNFSVTVTGMLRTFQSAEKLKEIANQNTDDLKQGIKHSVANILKVFNVIEHGISVFVDVKEKRDSFTIQTLIQCNCDYRVLVAGDAVTILGLERNMGDDIRKKVVEYLWEQGLQLKYVNVLVDSGLDDIVPFDSQRDECTWLVYQINETRILNESLTVISSERTYASGLFQILEEVVIVCLTETDLEVEEEKASIIDFALSIVTAVCVGISIVCLIVRIALQCFVQYFNNKPGKLHLQLSIALLVAFTMLIVGPFLSDIPDACTAAAVVMGYGFLAAFVWMNVIAVDTWLVFRPSSAFSRAEEEGRPLIIHLILGWGIPLLLVALPTAINYTNAFYRFHPNFGGIRCWYTQRYAMLVYFGIPVGMSILLNTILYIYTALSLYRSFQTSVLTTKTEGRHFTVYVRLFIMMGVAWIFGFISAFTEEVILDFIFIILTSLQGFFLFISFVCNKRVLTEMKKASQRKRRPSSGGSKCTNTTPVRGTDSSRSDSQL